MNYLKQLFTPYGRWNRAKFWLYPLPIMLIFTVWILWTIAFISLQGYQQAAIQSKLEADKNTLQLQINTLEVQGLTADEISQNQDVIYIQNEITQTSKKLTHDTEQSDDEYPVFVWLLFILLYPLVIYISITSYMKRFRDLGHNPWMTILSLIPIISIVVFFYCGFAKWTQWANEYGPDPLDPNSTDNNNNESNKDSDYEL